MAKGKEKKGSAGAAHSHLRARLDYLRNAAAYLQSVAVSSKQPGVRQEVSSNDEKKEMVPDSARVIPHVVDSGAASEIKSFAADESTGTDHLSHLSRVYISHLRGASLKSQLRLPVEVKRSFCKRCDTILIPEVNCVQEIRNASRNRKKTWADVRVVRCTTCGTEKRFPQTERRIKKLAVRRKEREQVKKQTTEP